MSTTSLSPSYTAQDRLPPARAPSYTAEPLDYEQRIAIVDPLRRQTLGRFTKEAKHGEARLSLDAQDQNAALPTYGISSTVEGVVEMLKVADVSSVEIKVRPIPNGVANAYYAWSRVDRG